MSEIFLYSFYVVSTLDRGHCVGVPQIVKTGFRQSKLGHHTLEAIIYGAVGEIASGLIGEDQVVVYPFLPCVHHHDALPLLLLTKQLNNSRRKDNDADLAVLRGGEVILSTLLSIPDQLTAHNETPTIKVDAIPGQAENFTLAHSRKESNLIQIFMRVTNDGL